MIGKPLSKLQLPLFGTLQSIMWGKIEAFCCFAIYSVAGMGSNLDASDSPLPYLGIIPKDPKLEAVLVNMVKRGKQQNLSKCSARNSQSLGISCYQKNHFGWPQRGCFLVLTDASSLFFYFWDGSIFPVVIFSLLPHWRSSIKGEPSVANQISQCK